MLPHPSPPPPPLSPSPPLAKCWVFDPTGGCGGDGEWSACPHDMLSPRKGAVALRLPTLVSRGKRREGLSEQWTAGEDGGGRGGGKGRGDGDEDTDGEQILLVGGSSVSGIAKHTNTRPPHPLHPNRTPQRPPPRPPVKKQHPYRLPTMPQQHTNRRTHDLRCTALRRQNAIRFGVQHSHRPVEIW